MSDYASAGDDWLMISIATIDTIDAISARLSESKSAPLAHPLILFYLSPGREPARGLNDRKSKPCRRASCLLYLL